MFTASMKASVLYKIELTSAILQRHIELSLDWNIVVMCKWC